MTWEQTAPKMGGKDSSKSILKVLHYSHVLTRTLPLQAILNGIDSIAKVLQYFHDQKKYPEVAEGYFGTLIQNFEVDKTFFTAVEVTAGNR